MHYVIKSNHDADPSEVVEFGAIVARISELSGRATLADGRPFGAYIVGQIGRTDRRTGRTRESVFVATDPGSEGRAIHGRGFIVQRVAVTNVTHDAESL